MIILKDGKPTEVPNHEVAKIAADAFDFLASSNGVPTDHTRIMIQQSRQLRELAEKLKPAE